MKGELKKARDFKKDTLVKEWIEDGIKAVIISRHSHFTAYLGIPADHPLSGFSYDDLPLSVHGGLIFGSEGMEKFPKGYFYYGWDYAHAGDYTYFDYRPDKLESDEHDWTLEEVEKEVKEAIYDFKVLVNLAEKIKLK